MDRIMTITKTEGGEYIATCAAGRVRFVPIGYKQVEIILEFSQNSGKAALECCREGLRNIFTQTDTLIVRGYIKSDNAASRAFGNALGFATIVEKNGIVEKRMTISRWRSQNGS